jgi:15-cis-phytoene synthase
MPHEAFDLLRQHGRTFWMASLLLSPDARRDATSLYAICRTIDDIADGFAPAEERLAGLDNARHSLVPQLSSILTMAREHLHATHALQQLVDGAVQDVRGVQIETTADLIDYAYRMAGTVGEVMCPILGVRDRRAYAFAANLGIAMQLSNIARDVAEDAANGRSYLPQRWLEGRRDPDAAATRMRMVLALAELYYTRARQGWQAIPRRNRLAIIAASHLYRAIGRKVSRMGCRTDLPRAVVSPWEKAAWLSVAFIDWSRSLWRSEAPPSLQPTQTNQAGMPISVEHG